MAGASFDARIRHAGVAISANYAELLVLSARQVIGAIEITISKPGSGSYNTEDIYVSNGNVNTVGVIFPSWPFFLYVK